MNKECFFSINGAGLPLNKISLYIDGPDAFSAIHEVIRDSSANIHIQIYFFREDETGWSIAEALASKVKKGVEVRVLYDESGWLIFHKRMKIINYLKDKGVKIQKERIFGSVAEGGNGKRSFRLFDLPAIARRSRDLFINGAEYAHRKLVISDGRQGIIGGMNFADEYAKADRWHDVMVKVEGPVVHDMQKEFLKSWVKSGDEKIALHNSSMFFPHRASSYNEAHPAYCTQVLASQRNSSNIKKALFEAIDNARQHIYIEHAYIIDDETIHRLLAAAAKGIKIKIIVSDKTDLGFYDEANKLSINRLLEAGAEVYLYNTFNGRRMIHMKVITIDGIWTTIGSANISNMSLNFNQEMNIGVTSRDFAREVEQRIFETDVRNSSILKTRLPVKWYAPWANVLLKKVL